MRAEKSRQPLLGSEGKGIGESLPNRPRDAAALFFSSLVWAGRPIGRSVFRDLSGEITRRYRSQAARERSPFRVSAAFFFPRFRSRIYDDNAARYLEKSLSTIEFISRVNRGRRLSGGPAIKRRRGGRSASLCCASARCVFRTAS